ncbi:hypothetical protein [Gemmobacter denitrificans]|uniref:DUF4229 domain-containing protein n=1 Tax=Gemmobacter denitrificans TaxID=3123040 RepID=A0ABU8BS72_9RHOB
MRDLKAARLLALACVATAAPGLLRLFEVWPAAGPLAAGLAAATLIAALVLGLSSRLALRTEAVLNRLRDRMRRRNAWRRNDKGRTRRCGP